MASKSGMNPVCLSVGIDPGVRAISGGVFICPGFGVHPERVLTSWELIVIERGMLAIGVGNSKHELRPGAWILMPSGIRHYGLHPYPRDLRFLWMHFIPSPKSSPGPLVLPGHGILTDPVAILTTLRRLIDHFSSSNPAQLVADCLVALVLSQLAEPVRVAASRNDIAHRALRIIHARFRDRLSPSDVARSLRVSLDHLAKRFRVVHGCRISEAINRERLQEASRLMLLGGGISLTDISAASGFPDPQWFRRLFVRHHGVSPRSWRRLHSRIYTNTQ